MAIAAVIVGGVLAIGVLWWLVFRAAMRRPNNGNDLAGDGTFPPTDR